MIKESGLLLIQCVDRCAVSFSKFKVKDINILNDSIRLYRFWNAYDPSLKQPSENNLSNALSVFFCDLN